MDKILLFINKSTDWEDSYPQAVDKAVDESELYTVDFSRCVTDHIKFGEGRAMGCFELSTVWTK